MAPITACPAATRVLGLLVPGLETTEIFGLICGELASLARAHEYSLLWGGSTHPHQDTDPSLEHPEDIWRDHFPRLPPADCRADAPGTQPLAQPHTGRA
jgi:hypothetical protein